MRAASIALAATTVLALGPLARAADDAILPNGLRVLVRPVRGTDRVAAALVFRVGEGHDDEGLSGLGHLTEHLFVTAATQVAPARTIEDVGARYPDGFNAFTTWDGTLWACVFPAARLEGELSDLAARLGGTIRVDEATLARERDRILDELGGMYERIPHLVAGNRGRELLFPPPPGCRRGGTPASLARATASAVNARLARFYTPRNAILALAGRVEPASVIEACRRVLGPLPPGDPAPPPRPHPAAVARPGALDLACDASPETGLAGAVFPAPPPGSPDYAPFLVLVTRLSGPARRAGLTFTFPPFEDGRTLTISTAAPPEHLARFLATDAAAWLAAPVSAAEAEIAASWVLGNPRAQTEYEAAFRAAMLALLGIDPDGLRRRIERTTPADLARVVPLGPRWPERGALVTLARPR